MSGGTIRIKDLPEATGTINTTAAQIAIDSTTTQRTSLQNAVNAASPIATQGEAEAGTDNAKRMTSLRVRQATESMIGAQIQPFSDELTAIAALPNTNAGVQILMSETPEEANSVLGVFETEADFVAATIDSTVTSVQTKGYYSSGDGGGHQKVRISTPSPVQPWHKQSADGAWWQIAKSDSIHVLCFGAKYDGSNETTIAQAAINFAVTFNVPRVVFDRNRDLCVGGNNVFYNALGSFPDRGLTIDGMRLKLISATPQGQVFGIGRGADVGMRQDIIRVGNLILLNPYIDGNDIAGENGIGMGRGAHNILILNPVMKNCQRDYVGTRDGGRGITAHARSRNVSIICYNAYRCSDAIHVTHAPDTSSGQGMLSAITAITRGATTQITLASNGFVVGDVVYIYGAGGININPSYSDNSNYNVISSSGNTITIDLDSSSLPDWTSGGNVVLADLTGGGRSPSVSVSDMYAEECENSVIHVEGANYPRSISTEQSIFISGVFAKNCGTNANRGLVIGNNANSVNINNFSSYNDEDHPVYGLIVGSFARSSIKATMQVDSLDYVINASPLIAGVGDSAGITRHPYGTSCDNDYDLLVILGKTLPSNIITTTDITGDIDYFYRNRISVKVTGLPDGQRYLGGVSNIALHPSNRIELIDLNSGAYFEGSGIPAGKQLTSGNSRELYGVIRNYGSIQLQATGSGGSEVSDFEAYNSAGSFAGRVRYTHSNNRWHFQYNGTSNAWQFGASAMLPGVFGAQNIGAVALPFGSIFATAIRQNSGIGTTLNPDNAPNGNGQLVIETTSNTTLTFKLRGSDGTVRSGTLTLS